MNLHDAEIVDLAIDRMDARVRIGLRSESGGSHELVLNDVQAFRCDDLSMQNVISRVRRSIEGNFSQEDLEYWLTWVTSLSDMSSWLSDEKKVGWCHDLRSGKLHLILLEPSAGATMAVVCRRIDG